MVEQTLNLFQGLELKKVFNIIEEGSEKVLKQVLKQVQDGIQDVIQDVSMSFIVKIKN